MADRKLLDDVCAASSREPLSPEVAAAGAVLACLLRVLFRGDDWVMIDFSVTVKSVQHPEGFREPCIYCERCEVMKLT